jgi:hypothetical protein
MERWTIEMEPSLLWSDWLLSTIRAFTPLVLAGELIDVDVHTSSLNSLCSGADAALVHGIAAAGGGSASIIADDATALQVRWSLLLVFFCVFSRALFGRRS